MKFGLYLSPQYPAEASLDGRLDELIEQVRIVRDAGFVSLWAPQHFVTAPMQMMQTHPLLARLAGEARGMSLGPSVLLLSMLNPVQVAEEAATLDWFADGGYVLAAGIGYRPEEFEALGTPMGERVGRMVESIGLMRRLWSGEQVSHAGRHFRVTDVGLSIRPRRPEGIPIWIGGGVPAAIRRAAEIADAWLISFGPTVADLHGQIALYREHRAALGLPPAATYPICREVYVGADHATALDECRGPLEYKYAAYASWGPQGMAAGADPFAGGFENFVRDRFIVGDAAFVRDELMRCREELGVDHFLIRGQWPGLDRERVTASLRRLGAVVASLPSGV